MSPREPRPRTCAYRKCDRPLPASAAAQARYCCGAHQVAEWRLRKREQDKEESK